MPYRVIKGDGEKPWKIQKPDEDMKWVTVGSSESKGKAQASVRARLATERE